MNQHQHGGTRAGQIANLKGKTVQFGTIGKGRAVYHPLMLNSEPLHPATRRPKTMTRLSLPILALSLLLLAGCGGSGGGGGVFDYFKQQVEIKISPRGEVTLEPGEHLTLSARATALGDSLSGMRWSLEQVSGPTDAPRPNLTNSSCGVVTLTMKGKDGKGQCTAEFSVPENMLPSVWRISAEAESESKGTDSARLIIAVTASQIDRDLTVTVPRLLPEEWPEQRLFPNQTVSIPATVEANGQLSGLSYTWSLSSDSPTVTLIGADTEQVMFIPREAGDYLLSVSVRGRVDNGDLKTAAANTLVVIDEPGAGDALLVSVSPPLEVQGGTAVSSLSGSATFNGNRVLNANYQWSQRVVDVEPPVALINASTLNPYFVAPMIGAGDPDLFLIFRLDATVNVDGVNYAGSAETIVRVKP